MGTDVTGGIATAAAALGGALTSAVTRPVGVLGAAVRSGREVVESLLSGGGPGDIDDRDPDYIRDTLPGFWMLARTWFRGEVRGMEHVPPEGPVLLVGNHSGGVTTPDTFVFTLAFNAYFGVERRFHPIAHDLVANLPGMRRYGVMPASHDNASRALAAGGAVLVYPGGDWEVYRPSRDRGRVDFGGRTGFVRLALDADVPVVPVVSVGGQEVALFLSRGDDLAQHLGLHRLRVKVAPIVLAAPWGLVPGGFLPFLPLPAKITVQVLEPIDLRERFGDDPDVDEAAELVTARMQSALDGLMLERNLPVVG